MDLIIDSKTGKCIKFECLLDEFLCQKENLSIPNNYQSGTMFFSSKEELIPGTGCHYFPFEQSVYYDEKNLIMLIGFKDAIGETVEFSSDIFAVVNSEQLMALYLKTPDLKGIIKYVN